MKLFTREELLPLARRQPEVLVDMFLALQQRLVELEQRVKRIGVKPYYWLVHVLFSIDIMPR
jgi:hypothetical protein